MYHPESPIIPQIPLNIKSQSSTAFVNRPIELNIQKAIWTPTIARYEYLEVALRSPSISSDQNQGRFNA